MIRTPIRPGMEIMLTDVTFEQDMKLHISEACQLFELSYCINGDIYCEWDGKKSYTEGQNGTVLFLEDVVVYDAIPANM